HAFLRRPAAPRLHTVRGPGPRAAPQPVHLLEHPAETEQLAGLQHPSLEERGIRLALPKGAARARSGETCIAVHPVERSPRAGWGGHTSHLVGRRCCDRELAPRRGLDRVGPPVLAARLLVPAGMTTTVPRALNDGRVRSNLKSENPVNLTMPERCCFRRMRLSDMKR